ncbi:MAG: glutamate-5-semialdehyde dehydrogenase, partial [Eubacteriales bacterium]
SRDSATALMRAVGQVDLLIPRGGKGLISACVENALVPCIETGTGICHLYVDASADLEKALAIVVNAKTSRPSVCNAAEVLLVHEKIAPTFLPMVEQAMVTDMVEHPVEFRCCPKSLSMLKGVPAGEMDFDTEFLDYKMAVKIVGSVEEATAHIEKHSTGHSEAILAEDEHAQKIFVQMVDSAAVYVNASTRFTDGGEFGLGCEIGISTQKLHARGPMGLEAMTSYKYVIRGNGQTR